MRCTLIVNSGEPEVVWNCFRQANLMLEQMDDVTIFLNGPAVRYQEMDCDRFPLAHLAKVFTLSEGELLA